MKNSLKAILFLLSINAYCTDNNIIYNSFPIKSLNNNLTVVMTGDSHVAGYSYLSDYGVGYDRFTEAKDNYPGIRPWSFIVRDLIYRNDIDFRHADEIVYTNENFLLTKYYSDKKSFGFHFPFNNKVVAISPNQTITESDLLSFIYTQKNVTATADLYFTTSPESDAPIFDILLDDIYYKTINTYSADRKTYNGYELLQISIPVENEKIKISFSNFRSRNQNKQADALYFLGIGSTHNQVFNTAKSGVTLEYIYDNIEQTILQYNPDIVFINSGLCDAVIDFALPNGVIKPENFRKLLVDLIKALRDRNPDIRIVFTGPTYHRKYSETLIDKYNNIIKDEAINNNCTFIDLIALFSGINNYRIDNAHYTFSGHTMVSSIIADFLFEPKSFKTYYLQSEVVFKRR